MRIRSTAMKVTIISPFYPGREAPDGAAHYGGVEIALARLAQELAAQGVDVTILTTARSSHVRTVGKVTVKAVKRLGVVFRNPVAFIGPVLLGTHGDVVHVAATYPGFSDLALLAARLQGTACVLDIHFEPVFEAPLAALLTHIYMRTGARLFRHYDRVLVHSRSYVPRCVSLRGLEPAHLVCIPIGVDCNVFQPTQPKEERKSWDQECPTVLFVGRLVPFKGVEVLLDAWPLVVRCLPRARLMIAGTGPLESKLRERAKRICTDIRFLGYVDHGELGTVYSGADVVVLPSVEPQESFGMTLLESMACGTPVVASDLPGVCDIASMGGKTSPPGDAVRLAAAIVDVVQDRNLARGWTLHERVREQFSWPQIAARHLQVYESILRNRADGEGKS